VLAPEKRNGVKLFRMTKNILSGHLSHAFSNHPVLDTNPLPGVRVGPAGSIASREDSRHTRFKVFVNVDTSIDRETRLLGHN